MSKFLAGARRPALCLVSLASMFAGGVTLWAMLDPESVRNASTPLLLGVLALLALPLLTLVAFEADRRARAERTLAKRARQMAREELCPSSIAARDIAMSAAHATPVRRHEPAPAGRARQRSTRRSISTGTLTRGEPPVI